LSLIEAIILGIVQGITEFLPISSTGHLTLAGKFMGLISEENPEHWTSFIAVIQLGTMLSIFVYFWKDLLNILTEFLQNNLQNHVKYSEQSTNSKLGWMIILGTIPIVVIGLLFKDLIEGALTKNLYVISGSLIMLAIILAIAEKTAKFKKNIENVTILDSVLIGLAQAVALIPGSSRSGTTITGGLLLGGGIRYRNNLLFIEALYKSFGGSARFENPDTKIEFDINYTTLSLGIGLLI